jgi:hypothetical protein
MKYYRAHLICGSKFKKKQSERIIFVQSKDKLAPISYVLDIIRKIPFGRMISVREVDREEYIRGVSRVSG